MKLNHFGDLQVAWLASPNYNLSILQYVGQYLQTNDVPVSLSSTLCLVLISKFYHANTLN